MIQSENESGLCDDVYDVRDDSLIQSENESGSHDAYGVSSLHESESENVND